jgi:hypothetical protein
VTGREFRLPLLSDRRNLGEWDLLPDWLVNLDNIAIWILQEDLIPVSHCPHAIVCIWNLQLLEALLEALDVICPEAEMPAMQWVDRLLHSEAQVDVLGCQMEFDGTISHEIHIRAVTVGGIGIAADVFLILDPVEGKNVSVELGKTRNVFGAEIHVVEVKFHGWILRIVIG